MLCASAVTPTPILSASASACLCSILFPSKLNKANHIKIEFWKDSTTHLIASASLARRPWRSTEHLSVSSGSSVFPKYESPVIKVAFTIRVFFKCPGLGFKPSCNNQIIRQGFRKIQLTMIIIIIITSKSLIRNKITSFDETNWRKWWSHIEGYQKRRSWEWDRKPWRSLGTHLRWSPWLNKYSPPRISLLLRRCRWPPMLLLDPWRPPESLLLRLLYRRSTEKNWNLYYHNLGHKPKYLMGLWWVPKRGVLDIST